MRGSGRANDSRGQVRTAPEQVDELKGGQPDGHGIDGEVTTDEVLVEPSAEVHLRLAGLRVVGLRAIGGDLHLASAHPGTDRAEADADVPRGLRHRLQQREDDVGMGIGGEVQVGLGLREPTEQGIPHGTTDEGEFVAGLLEDPAQCREHARRVDELRLGCLVEGQRGDLLVGCHVA